MPRLEFLVSQQKSPTNGGEAAADSAPLALHPYGGDVMLEAAPTSDAWVWEPGRGGGDTIFPLSGKHHLPFPQRQVKDMQRFTL